MTSIRISDISKAQSTTGWSTAAKPLPQLEKLPTAQHGVPKPTTHWARFPPVAPS